MEFIKGILRSVFTQVLSTFIITILGIGTTSAINTGNFFNYLSGISFQIWILILISSIIIVFIIKLIFINRENSVYYPMMAVITDNREVGSMTHSGVKWKIMYPRTTGYEGKVNLSHITVDSDPLCPKCNTELIEKKAIVGRFRWKCPNCRFSKRKLKNKHMVALEAENIARMQIEKDLK